MVRPKLAKHVRQGVTPHGHPKSRGPCRGRGHQAILSVHRRAPQSTRSCLLLELHDAANSCRAGRRRLRRDRSRWRAWGPAECVRGATNVVTTACPREPSVRLGTACRHAVGRSPTAVESGAPKAVLLRRSLYAGGRPRFSCPPGYWPSRLWAGDLSSHLDSARLMLLEAAPA